MWSAKDLEEYERRIMPALIYVVALALVMDTAFQLSYDILDYKQYQFVFQWLSPGAIFLRYCLSIIFRCALLLSLFGICLRKEFFRKSLLVLTGLGLAVLFWRHPYQAVNNANVYAHVHLSYPQSIVRMFEIYAMELLKGGLVLIFFSFPAVRKIFTNN